MHKAYILGLPLLEVRRQIPKITTDDHYHQSVAVMTRCKLVALKVLSTLYDEFFFFKIRALRAKNTIIIFCRWSELV